MCNKLDCMQLRLSCLGISYWIIFAKLVSTFEEMNVHHGRYEGVKHGG